MNISEISVGISHEMLPILFGDFDVNMKQVEKSLNVTIVNRGEKLKIIGIQSNVQVAKKVIENLKHNIENNIEINVQVIDYAINRALEEKSGLKDLGKEYVCITPNGKYIRPKTMGQKKYIENIRDKMIVFGVGPAGTGKTYLAMAHAITAFKKNEVNRIILTRPAIEAGEKLGFLPGDLQSKVDPYLRPLYDALYEIMGADVFLSNMEKGLIEVAPLAYMRGRTLDNAFIVLDEAQNTTPAQMKMFLTRIGYGSKAVITGDITQKDLPPDKTSGLETALKVLGRMDEIGISKLSSKDVVRHPLVQKIVSAYDAYEDRNKTKNNGKERPKENIKSREPKEKDNKKKPRK